MDLVAHPIDPTCLTSYVSEGSKSKENKGSRFTLLATLTMCISAIFNSIISMLKVVVNNFGFLDIK